MAPKTKIYIAGKVTGLHYPDVKQKFRAAENLLASQGYQVINPIQFIHPNTSWEDAMKECMDQLHSCQAIYMLSDWLDSKGARLEYSRAIELNQMVLYQTVQHGSPTDLSFQSKYKQWQSEQ